MKIVVTGSLGHVGKPLTKALLQKGNTVTVISSKADKQKDIEALGATAAIGSLEDADFLKQTFTGADAVFVMIPPNFGKPDQLAYYEDTANRYVSAIQAASIKRIVHLSSYGADLDKGTGIILGSHKAEGILDTLADVAITHLRPGYFYYNLYNFTDMIKSAGFIGANFGGNDPMVLVDPTDIATAAAEELVALPSGNSVRYVASDERTCNEIAEVLGAAIGKPDLKWITFTDEQVQQGMEQRGMPAGIVANLVELGAATHSGILRTGYEQYRPTVLGNVKLEDFAQSFAAAY